jgi:hypothetical protein
MSKTATSALVVAAAGFFLIVPHASAQTDAVRDSEIVVRHDRPVTEREIRQGVHKLIDRITVIDAMPRFIGSVCLKVMGLEANMARKVEDRIRKHILDLELELADGKCRPNAMVIVAGDPELMLSSLRRSRPWIFGQLQPAAVGNGVSVPGRNFSFSTLRSEVERGKPAVAWSVNVPPNAPQGAIFVSGAGAGGPQLAARWEAFRSQTVPRPKSHAVVMFDWRQLNGVHLDQLADYATLQLLGSPRRNVDSSYAAVPTILTLFAEGPERAPQRLTRFDRAYLCGLHRMPPSFFAFRLTGYAIDADANNCLSEGERGAKTG